MSPRRNWDSPTPAPASKCAPPPRTRGGGGGQTRLRVRGWGSLSSDDWRKSLALCLLCVFNFLFFCALYVSLTPMQQDKLKGQLPLLFFALPPPLSTCLLMWIPIRNYLC